MPGRKVPEGERREQILAAAFGVAVRERLAGLTVRRVAAEAGVSSGLVFFHFGTKDGLLVALLDWLIERSVVLRIGEDVFGTGSARERLLGLVRQEAGNSARDREELGLLFDYWAYGTDVPGIREKVRDGLRRWREGLRGAVVGILAKSPDAFPGVSPEGFSSLVVSAVEGCAVRAVFDPDRADDARVVAAMEELLNLPAAAGTISPAR